MVHEAGRRLPGQAPGRGPARGERGEGRGLSAYWACQLAGWTLYMLVNAGLGVAFGKGPGASLLMALPPCALGLALSHGLRKAAGQRWRALSLLALAPRLVGASVALSVLENAAVVSYFRLSRLGIAEPSTSGPLTMVWVFNWSVVFLVWQLLYFGSHVWRQARRAERLAWQLEAAAREAELGRLKAQLNPHFLFNCLNGLRSLIAEDPERARDMVTQLASMLRYTLSASAEETAELGCELEAVRDYLALEGVRLEGRLRVRFDVEAPCEAVRVPTMLVQLLVENAVKHGIAKRPEGGEVSLSARRDGDLLRLEVRNPLGTSPSLAGEGAGVGLANAAERLRLLFGEAASLELGPSAHGEMRAEVRLPWPN